MGHIAGEVTDKHYTARNLARYAPHVAGLRIDPGVLARLEALGSLSFSSR
jgi:hypothetical protein